MKKIDFVKLIESFHKLSKREKMIFYVTAIIVSVTLLDQVIVRPVFNTIRSLDQQIFDLESKIKKSIRLLSQKERMMKEAEFYASYSAESKSPEEDSLVLLKHIQEVANDTSINLLYVKPAGSKENESITRVNLECEGQIDQLVGFFYAIENSKLLLRVEKYSLQPTAKGSSVIKCVATISMAGTV